MEKKNTAILVPKVNDVLGILENPTDKTDVPDWLCMELRKKLKEFVLAPYHPSLLLGSLRGFFRALGDIAVTSDDDPLLRQLVVLATICEEFE